MEIGFEQVAIGHEAKYGYLPIQQNLRSALRLTSLWEERLGHQVSPLPPFQDVLGNLGTTFNEWQESNS